MPMRRFPLRLWARAKWTSPLSTTHTAIVLSRHGCYLDMMNPFPQDTLVLVKIFAGEDFFHAKAKIIYVQPNLGCGVSFLEVEPQALAVLGRWLATAQQDGQKRSG